MMKYILLSIIILILLFTSSCSTKKIITGDSTISVNGSTTELESKDGKTKVAVDQGGNASLPEGYPANDFPIIKGAKIILASYQETNSKMAYHIMFNHTSKAEEVFNYYAEIFKDIKDIQKVDTPTSYMLSGKKGGYEFVINILNDKGQTGVQIALEQK